MDFVEVFYFDRFGRKVYTFCTLNEFSDVVIEMVELALDKGVTIMYTYLGVTQNIDYYNLPVLQ